MASFIIMEQKYVLIIVLRNLKNKVQVKIYVIIHARESLVMRIFMKKYQQLVFRKYKGEQPMRSKETPRLFREYMAQRMIERINGGEY